MPSERPQDVYTGVLKVALEKLDKHADDPKHPSHEFAKVLQGHVTRKVVKQTVMTRYNDCYESSRGP